MSKLHITGLCEGNSPVTGEFPAQRASNAENVSIWWRHHGPLLCWIHSTRHEICICIFYQFWTPIWRRQLKSFLVDKDSFILASPGHQQLWYWYHSCWCPGDARGQGISSQGSDPFFRTISVLILNSPQSETCIKFFALEPNFRIWIRIVRHVFLSNETNHMHF